MTIIPVDHDAAPSITFDRAKIGEPSRPANPVANLEQSRLLAGHLRSKRSSLTSIGKMLPENAIAKAGSQTPERKVRYQNQ
jgi:hypothetical protein